MMNARARELGLTKSIFAQRHGHAGPGPEGDCARPREARAAHHRDLSGPLQDLRRARVHLEQDQAAEPQSAARHGHRRRRAEDRLHRRIRLRPGRLRRAERPAADHGGQRPEDREGPRGGSRASSSTGASAPSSRAQLFAQGETVGEAKVFGGAKGSVPLVARKPVRLLLPRGSSDRMLGAQDRLPGPADGAGAAGAARSARLRVMRGDTSGARPCRSTRARTSAAGSLHASAPSMPPASSSSACAGRLRDRRNAAEPMRGRFITFEGGEGAGKSTQIGRLARRLRGARPRASWRPASPAARRGAEEIREVAPVGRRQAARARARRRCCSRPRAPTISRQTIRPALERGDWVLCDRFADSTRAYQGAPAGSTPDSLTRSSASPSARPGPDLTLILDLPAETGLARAARAARDGGEVDRFEAEALDFHERLREAFLRHRRARAGALRRDRCGRAMPDAVEARVWAVVARPPARLSSQPHGGRPMRERTPIDPSRTSSRASPHPRETTRARRARGGRGGLPRRLSRRAPAPCLADRRAGGIGKATLAYRVARFAARPSRAATPAVQQARRWRVRRPSGGAAGRGAVASRSRRAARAIERRGRQEHAHARSRSTTCAARRRLLRLDGRARAAGASASSTAPTT